MRIKTVQVQAMRKAATFLLLAAATAAAYPSFAQRHPRERAHVFSRQLSGCQRVIFSWDSHEKVPFEMRESGNTVTLHFERPVLLSWASALEASETFMFKPKTPDDGYTYIITLRQPYTARYFVDDSKEGEVRDENGIDFFTRRHAAPTATLEVPRTVPHVSRPGLEMADNDYPPAPEKQSKWKKTYQSKGKNEKLTHFAKKKAAPVMQVAAKDIQGEPAMPKPPPDAAALASLSPAAGTHATKASLAAPPAAAETPQATPPANAAPFTGAPATSAAVTPAETTPPPDIVTQITLPIVEGDPFAVFARKGSLWVAVDKAEKLTTDTFRASPLIGDAQQLPATGENVFHMTLKEDLGASVERTSPQTVLLTLRHSHSPARLSDPLFPSLRSDDGKQFAMSLPAGKGEHVVSLEDPATGEPLFIVPYARTGTGVAIARTMVQFNLLATAQGVAVEKKADDLRVAIRKNRLEISSPNGLDVSQEATQQAQEEENDAINSHLPLTLFPYARWKLGDEKNFVPAEIKLFHAIAFGNDEAANKARLKLLDLYLGEGLFAEAEGMANDILRSSYAFYRDNHVAALRGAAHFFMYRFVEAARDFSAPELKGNAEAALWLSLCKELLGQPGEPFHFAANYDGLIQYYPPAFIQKLAIIAADRDINRKQYDAALAVFDDLKKDNLDDPVRKYVDFMRGKIFSETGEEDEAAKIWEKQASDVDDPLIRARAEFSLVNMLLRQDRITHEDAIQRLDRLRAVWRGDNLEVSVLTLLGNLELDDKQYARALHTMRDIVLYYPQVPEALATAEKMEQVFISLYNKGGANAMQPLDALALFYEFRDLVPNDATGDLIIRNLADRLVGIDLLDRAARLLDHQINKRLVGEARSEVGARLALIYLLNHQPKEALDTLKTTGYGNLPADLQAKRIRLTAQALAQQGKPDIAIDVLSNDTSPEGMLLRLSIYWDNKDWPNVVNTAEEFLGNRNDPSAPLTPQESDVLLKLATAYVYEHDTGQIQYLRDYFTPLLKDNPNKASFLFITSESGTIDYENLANLDQDITTVKSFLDTYRDKVKKNGLSKAL